MRILALQLKRIGDLILTTPALALLRRAFPNAHLTLAVGEGCAPLLGAITGVNASAVFGRGRGFAPWQHVMTGPWDVCLDFTGNDRSALATALSRADQRVTFASVRRSRFRALAYNRFIDSPVRERHTVDHYTDLALGVLPTGSGTTGGDPVLTLPASADVKAGRLLADAGVAGPFALLHPGTARAEKFWRAERWAEVGRALHERHGLRSLVTGGDAEIETTHVGDIARAGVPGLVNLAASLDLPTLAALVARARIVISCDTAVVHLAAAFRRPQIALFGPTNPFHWRPRHAQAIVVSAAQPSGPLTDFQPRMKGAPMDHISTAAVIHATEVLLADDSDSSPSS